MNSLLYKKNLPALFIFIFGTLYSFLADIPALFDLKINKVLFALGFFALA